MIKKKYEEIRVTKQSSALCKSHLSKFAEKLGSHLTWFHEIGALFCKMPSSWFFEIDTLFCKTHLANFAEN